MENTSVTAAPAGVLKQNSCQWWFWLINIKRGNLR